MTAPLGLSWRRYGAALVPLALAGLLTPWALLSFCLLFGLGVYSPRWAHARLAAALVIAALLTFGQLSGVPAVDEPYAFLGHLSFSYLNILIGILLLHIGLLGLEEGKRSGLLAILLAGLLSPQPGLLAALLAGAVLRQGPDDLLGQQLQGAQEQRQAQRGWSAVGLALLAVTALAFLLPRRAPPAAPAPPAQAQTAPHPKKPAMAQAKAFQRRPSAGNPALDRPAAHSPVAPAAALPPLQLLSETLLVGLVLLAGQLWRKLKHPEARPQQKWTPLDMLLPLALLLNTLALGLLGVLKDSDSAQQFVGSATVALVAPGGAAQRTVGQLPESLAAAAAWLLWGLSLLLILLAAWRLWRIRPPSTLLSAAPPASGQAATLPSAHPPDRVRLAYQQAEQALAQAGYPRRAAETPTLYAARLSALFPTLEGALPPLTRLYIPVRYADNASSAGAQQAESAAANIIQLAAQLPLPLKDSP